MQNTKRAIPSYENADRAAYELTRVKDMEAHKFVLHEISIHISRLRQFEEQERSFKKKV